MHKQISLTSFVSNQNNEFDPGFIRYKLSKTGFVIHEPNVIMVFLWISIALLITIAQSITAPMILELKAKLFIYDFNSLEIVGAVLLYSEGTDRASTIVIYIRSC